jgi:putative membrane protein
VWQVRRILTGMTAVAAVLAALAAALHVYIFVLESLVFRTKGRHVFGVREDSHVDVVERWAFNQGFYNLFLAVGAAVGAVNLAAGNHTVGSVLVFVSAGSMVGAGSVLLGTDRRMMKGALVQIVPAGLAVVATALAL